MNVGTRLKSLKVIGRKKITFHLDEITVIHRMVNGQYLWFCQMAEANPHQYGAGVSCEGRGMGYNNQYEAEEAAVQHLQLTHRAHGGEKLEKGRGIVRRAREIDAWNARRLKEKRG